MKKLKILVLNYEYPPLGGGAGPVTKELCETLSKNNHIDVVTMSYHGLKKKESKKNLNIYRVPCIRRKKESSNFLEMLSFILPAYKKSVKLIKKNNYDLIHAHFIIPTGIIAYFLKKRFDIPYIITSHGSDVPGYNPDRFGFLHKIIQPFWKKVIRNSKKIITPSNELKKLINKSIKTDITVIPNGIHVNNNTKYKKENIVLYAGRLFKRKGVQHLIKAFDLTDWQLVIAGEGPYKKELEKLGKSNFVGWLSKKELEKLYKKSSIFVLPSMTESFGMVLIEAMNHGCAIISTKGTATQEVVGNSGVLVEYGSSASLRKALIDVSIHLKRYQELSKRRVRKFDWIMISKRYQKVYDEVSKK